MNQPPIPLAAPPMQLTDPQQQTSLSLGTVYSVALNHPSLLAHWQAAFSDAPYKQLPQTPVWFIKPRNTLIGQQQAIIYPEQVPTIQPGATLAVVIAKPMYKVPANQALNYIAGYTIANEISLPEDSFYRPAIKAKCRDSFCPIGPYLIPASAVANPQQLNITTYINGQVVANSNTSELLRSIPELLAALSDFCRLEAGDVLLTGTTLRQCELKVGDQVAVEISGLGRLENTVVAETTAGGQA